MSNDTKFESFCLSINMCSRNFSTIYWNIDNPFIQFLINFEHKSSNQKNAKTTGTITKKLFFPDRKKKKTEWKIRFLYQFIINSGDQ